MTAILLTIIGLLTIYNFVVLRSLKKKIEETKDSIHSQISWAKEDLRGDMQGLRTVLRVVAAGGMVSEDMIAEGKPYADIAAADAMNLLREKPQIVVIDVRSPGEFQEGHIPGARLVPVDEIESRLDEVPRDAEALLITCQGGTRSAFACQLLSERGYTNLINMYDGMGSWPGKKEIGPTIRPPSNVTNHA